MAQLKHDLDSRRGQGHQKCVYLRALVHRYYVEDTLHYSRSLNGQKMCILKVGQFCFMLDFDIGS